MTNNKSPMKAALLAEQVVEHVLATVAKTGRGRMFMKKESLEREKEHLIEESARMIFNADLERDS